MKEIIIVETNKPQKLKSFLDKEHFSYKVYQESKQNQEQLEERLISVYKRIAKNKKLQAELTL